MGVKEEEEEEESKVISSYGALRLRLRLLSQPTHGLCFSFFGGDFKKEENLLLFPEPAIVKIPPNQRRNSSASSSRYKLGPADGEGKWRHSHTSRILHFSFSSFVKSLFLSSILISRTFCFPVNFRPVNFHSLGKTRVVVSVFFSPIGSLTIKSWEGEGAATFVISLQANNHPFPSSSLIWR